MLDPNDVDNKQFTVVHLRAGYAQDEVDAYLDEVASTLRLLMEDRTQVLPVVERTEALPRVVVDEIGQATRLLALAEKAAEQDKIEAGIKAREIIRDGEAEALKIVANARTRAADIISDAESRKNEIVGNLEETRDALQRKVNSLVAAQGEIGQRLREAFKGLEE